MIDWTTVAFQIVNFLVLLFLLKTLLYGRIIAAMDQREAAIAAQIHDAETKAHDAAQQAETLRQQQQELADQRDELLAQAQADADAARKELLGKARADADQTRTQWQQALEREKDGFLHDLRSRVSQQTLAIARRALADLADADLESRVAAGFAAQLDALDDTERATLAAAIAKTADDVAERSLLVRSAFALPDDARQRLVEAIHQRIADGIGVDFETSGEVVAGIELSAGGTKLAWSLGHYLASLEEELATSLEAQAAPRKEEKKEKEQGSGQD